MNLIQRVYRLFVNLKQRTSRLLGVIIVCLAGLFGVNPSANAATWFVDGGVAECDNLGNSWPNAFKYLQDALDAASLGDDVWVKAGTYKVDQSCANEVGSGDRAETFQLVKGVFLLGGFNGTESFASERDSVLYITILSGMVDDGGPSEECGNQSNKCGGVGSCFQEHGPACEDGNCCRLVCGEDPGCCCNEWDQLCVDLALDLCGEAYHVVTAGSEIDDPEQTVIDGFTIRDGWANGSTLLDQHHGGGMFIEGEPSVVRCTFRQNTASAEGGGMTIKGLFKRPHIINAIFEENPGDPATPGDQQVFPINGGGLASIGGADPILTNCLFVQNTAKQAGGAIYNSAGTCIQNPPPGGSCGRITLINCTVAFNTADLVGGGHKGGGLHFDGETGRLEAENTIVWGNIPNANQIDGALTAAFVNFSDCEGGCPSGTDNIDVTPLFVGAPGDLRLTINSLCIDAGNPDETVIPCDFFDLDNDARTCAPAPEEATPDLDLVNRVLDGDDDGEAIVDMGAYEFIHPNVCPCPDICPADLNGDCVVDVKDLLILLGAWGPNPGHPADFDGSGAVDVKDLLFLLGAWGRCPCAEGPPPPSLADELAAACVSQENWDDFLDVMQTGSEAEKENWLCWMNHHLNVCTNCFCPHSPEICPGPDPF